MKRLSVFGLSVLLALLIAQPAAAQSLVGTRFTYQGRLYDAGIAQTGLYDIRFELFANETDPAPLDWLVRSNVPVSSGLFKVDMGFGLGGVLLGKWLRIGVAPGNTGGPFTLLSPMQELTPIPRAILSGTTLNIANGVVVRDLNGQKDNVTLSGSNGLSVSAGGGTVTVTSNATPSDTPDTIVSRDGGGGLAARNISMSGDLYLPSTGVVRKQGSLFIHNFGLGNTFLGLSAGNTSLSGPQNTAVGEFALTSTVFGAYNSAFGAATLFSNTDGQENSAFGFEALRSNDTGFGNSAFGSHALATNTGGGDNVAIGRQALASNTAGLGNVGIGYIALSSLMTGDMNIAIGLDAGGGLTSGSHNIYLGAGSNGGPVESNTIRLGNPAIHTATHLTGSVVVPGKLSFGAQTRQMIDLWNSAYGIGVQPYVQYFRADGADALNGFAWYKGGGHADAAYDPGGGVTLMTLNQFGLTVNGTFVSSSDRALKQDVKPVDPEAILEEVGRLPISEWSYRADSGVRHVGPMAQDFRAAFGLGKDERHIATVDADGVALAAIQALKRVVEGQRAELAAQQGQIAELKALMAELGRVR